MKLSERILGFDPQERFGERPYYELGKAALKWMGVGAGAIVLGEAAKVGGDQESMYVAYSGMAVYGIGSLSFGGVAIANFLEEVKDGSDNE